MSWGMVVAAGVALVGTVVQSNSSKKASAAQQKSAEEANALGKETSDAQVALQREMFNKTNEINKPALDAGNAARNQLMHYLGLSNPSGQAAAAAPAMMTREQMRAQLRPQFQTSSNRTHIQATGRIGDDYIRYGAGPARFEPSPDLAGLDEAGLNAAVEAQWAKQAQAQQAYTQAQGAQSNDPSFGSLMRDFSMADFQRDPGAQFRMDEGQKALERSASARGGLLSGSAAKDTMRFAQNLGSQDYQAAFDRFQVNRANKLNPLQSMSGAGQTAAGTIGNAGQNFANSAGNALGQYAQNAGNNMMGAGNARASGYLAQGNAIQGGLNQGVSLWQQYQQRQQQQQAPTQSNVTPGSWS